MRGPGMRGPGMGRPGMRGPGFRGPGFMGPGFRGPGFYGPGFARGIGRRLLFGEICTLRSRGFSTFVAIISMAIVSN